MMKSPKTNMTLDEALITAENRYLRNPLFGGFNTVFALLTDDHTLHIKAHLKYWYNPATWLHIHQHWMQLKIKRNMGIEHVTNDAIMETQQAQHEEAIADHLMNQPDPKKPNYN